MNDTYYVDISRRQLCLPGEGRIKAPLSYLPNLYLGSCPTFHFLFSEGVLSQGDTLMAAIDIDKNFIATSPMVKSTINVGLLTEEIAIPLETRTMRFKEAINGRGQNVQCYFMIFRISGAIQETLCDDFCYCNSVVDLYGSADPTYYTKEEIDAMIARIEEGQALFNEALQQIRWRTIS